jgi:hypothetical protein
MHQLEPRRTSLIVWTSWNSALSIAEGTCSTWRRSNAADRYDAAASIQRSGDARDPNACTRRISVLRHDRFRPPAVQSRTIALAILRSSRSGAALAAARFRVRLRASDAARRNGRGYATPMQRSGTGGRGRRRNAGPLRWNRRAASSVGDERCLGSLKRNDRGPAGTAVVHSGEHGRGGALADTCEAVSGESLHRLVGLRRIKLVRTARGRNGERGSAVGGEGGDSRREVARTRPEVD